MRENDDLNSIVSVEVLGQGQPTTRKVTYAFEKRIAPDSIMLSDRTKGIKSFFKKKNVGSTLVV